MLHDLCRLFPYIAVDRGQSVNLDRNCYRISRRNRSDTIRASLSASTEQVLIIRIEHVDALELMLDAVSLNGCTILNAIR